MLPGRTRHCTKVRIVERKEHRSSDGEPNNQSDRVQDRPGKPSGSSPHDWQRLVTVGTTDGERHEKRQIAACT